MKTFPSLPALAVLVGTLVCGQARAEFPLVSSTSVSGGAVTGSQAYRLAQNPVSGDLYAAGALSAGASNLNIWLGRYSPELVALSSYTYDKSGFDDAAFGVALDTGTGVVFAAGYVSSAPALSGRDIWLARFSSSLVLQSSITVDGSAGDRDEAVSLRVAGGIVYVVGLSSQPGGKGFWLANFDQNLVMLSSGNYYQNNAEVSDLLPTAAGTFVAGSRAVNFGNSNDAWVGKFDANHVFVASSAYNGPASQSDHMYSMVDDGSGGIFAVGFVYSGTMADQYIAHFNSSLVRTASTTINGPGNNNDTLQSIAWTSSGTLMITGSYSEVAGLGGINNYVAEYDTSLHKLSSGAFTSAGSGIDTSFGLVVGVNQDLYSAGWAANGASRDIWLGRFSTSAILPSIPAGLAASGVGIGAAALSWTSGGNRAGSFYQIERSTGTDFGLRQSSTSLSFSDPLLSPGATFYYRVRALNSDLAASAYSSTIAVVALPAPVLPSLSSFSPAQAASGASVSAAAVGTGLDPAASLAIERPSGTAVWTATASFAQPRQNVTLTKLRDGRALLVGGMLEGGSGGRTETDLFSLTLGSWTAGAPTSEGRLQHAAVMLADGRVLVTGGQAAGGSVVATGEIYDPSSGVWTVVAPMSAIRKGHRTVLLPNGKVLAVGGYTNSIALASAEIYDPALNTWTAAAPIPGARFFPVEALLSNGKVLIAGGRDAAGNTLTSSYLYDYLLDSWSATGPMNPGRSDHWSATLPDGRVLAAGGIITGSATNTAEVFDPASSSWTATGAMSVARRDPALVLYNGRALIIGGQSNTTDYATTEIYDAALNSWSPGPALLGTRTVSAAATLDDGGVLVAGGRRGMSGGTTLNTAERLAGPATSIAATGVSSPDAQHVNGTLSLAGAATGYWDVVVRQPLGRVGRLSGGVWVSTPLAAPSGFAGVAQSSTSILWSWTDASSDELGFRVKFGGANVSGDLAANATTWLQTGLTANATSGNLLAQSFNLAGTADSSSAVRYSLTEPPNSIGTTFYGSSVAITWPSMTNPAGTRWSVERATDGVSYATLSFSSASASYTDAALSAATTYYYRIRAANEDGVYSFHANSSAILFTGSALPVAPSGFAGTALSTSSILWSWTDNSNNEIGFRIKSGGLNVSGDLAAGVTAWLQTTLTANASASLLVQAYNIVGTADSAAAGRYALAAAPAGLASSFVGVGAATISWTANGNAAGTVYQLERSTGSGYGLRQSGSGLSFFDAALTAASTYYYRVRAVNGDLSASAYASTIAVVTAPAGVYPSIASVSPSSAAAGGSASLAVVGTGFASSSLSLERAAPGAGVWTATGSFTTPRQTSEMVKLRDGRALLIGGQLEGSGAGLAQVDLFDLSSGVWSAAASLNVGRYDHGVVLLADGRVLVAGGQAPDASTLSSAEIYDPSTGAWTIVAPMSQVRKGHSMARLPDGRVLAVGGINGALVANLTAEIYDPALNAWSAAAPMSVVRTYASATLLSNGKVLVAGGRDPTNKSASAQLYDYLTNTWTATNPMSIGRADHEAVVLPDGKVLIAGGLDTVGESAGGDVYDPATSSWTATGAMAVSRRSLSLVLVNGTPLAIGGQNASTDFASTDLYDAASNSWAPGPSLLGRRTIASAVVLDDGQALIAGGRRGLGGGTTLNTAERLGVAGVSIAAAGVTVPDAQHVNGTASLASAATGYWDVVVREPGGKTGRFGGGVFVYAPPAAPSGFTGTGQSTSSILWSWTDNSGEETGYRVMSGTASLSGNLAANTTAWLQTGLGVNASAGTLFAQAFGSGGFSASGSLARYSLAAAPFGLASSGVFQTTATVTWASGNPAGTVFEIERSSGAGFANVGLATVTFHAASGLAEATTYWYRVRAVNGDGVPTAYASSSSLVTRPAPPPAAAAGFAGAAQSASSILWTWSDNASDEAGYRVMAGTVSVSGDLAAGTTLWLQTGLAANSPYGPYFARAFNAGGTADSSTASRYTFAAAPGTPAASGVSQTGATVSWSASGNPAGTVYQLERATAAAYGVAFAGAATSYLDAALASDATYYYRVRALNGDAVATAYASTLTVVTPPFAPSAPGAPAGAALGTSSVSWTWALSPGATAYFLYRASDLASLGSAAAGAFTQTGLSANTAYGLRVAGRNAGGTSALSASATAYTLAAAPTGAAAASITSTTLVASWALAGNPAGTAAVLERSVDALAYSTAASGAITSYFDSGLAGCTTYYYRVRNANGDGVPTAYASFSAVTANTLPGPPNGLNAWSNAGGTIGLGWGFSQTEGVTGYRLYWDAGSGTVSYGAPLAVLTSTETSYTTGVLASSAAYTFALRSVHRCGTVDATGAFAMSGAAAVLAEVRAAIKEPDSGRRVNGNRVTILAELIAGTPSDVQQIVFQYKSAASSTWLDVGEANVEHPNPDFSFPYFVHVDVTALAAGDYDLRAVAYDLAGVPDPAPPAVRVVVDPVTPDVSETQTIDGRIKKDQTVSNLVTSVVDTAGSGAADPAVRVTIPVGAVNSTTATVSVIANPAITTAAPAGQSLVGSAIKIDLSNGQSALNGTAEITLTYPDTVLFPSLLQIYYLNEATGQWSRDFNSVVDTASRTVSGRTPHFSTFAIMLGTAFASDLSNVRAYPVPFKPNGSNPDEGRPFSAGDANSGIIFSNLASGSEIRIYTVTGRLVASLDSPSATGAVRWDARNQDGRDVASGAYFAVISAAGQKNVVKKLVIIR